MRCKTQKLVFYAVLAVLAIFLFACKPFASGDYDESGVDEITYTDVVYSQDGKSLTIYLEGTVPVTRSQSRALSLKLAKLGHDFFEVAFAYKNDIGQLTIARAAWETGQAAGVTGVYRTESGVDYSNVRNVGGMSNGQASAVIFAGKKSDKTLLAVGRLMAVDGIGSINPPVSPPNITTATRTVTFAVDALEGGTGFDTASSTFLTAAKDNTSPYNDVSAGNTNLSSILIARNPTPVYIFPAVTGRTTAATYTINGIGGYLNGIILAGPAVATETIPRHPLGNGSHDDFTLGIGLETSTVISVTTNQIAGNVFNNVVGFDFTTADAIADDGTIGAFYFEIPVYPLSALASPGTWYIRPGYDSFLLDLDGGVRGTGGAVLYGIGDLGYMAYGLKITKPPNKVNYSNSYNYNFDPAGLIAWMQSGTFRVKRVDVTDPNLKFYIIGYGGSPDVLITSPLTSFNLYQYFRDISGGIAPTNPPNQNYAPNKMLTIEARYTDTDLQVYHDRFAIYDGQIDGLVSDPESISPGNRSVIHSWLDLTFFYNSLNSAASGDTFILISYFSFDLQQIHFNASNFVIIVLAGAPDVIIGREPTGGFQHYSGSTGNTYFVGVWPFNEPVSVDGMAITTYPFSINTTGSYAAVGTGPGGTTPAAYTDGFVRLQGAVGAATADVQVGGGVDVINPAYLKVQGP